MDFQKFEIKIEKDTHAHMKQKNSQFFCHIILTYHLAKIFMLIGEDLAIFCHRIHMCKACGLNMTTTTNIFSKKK